MTTVNIFEMAQTWNNAATVFDGISLNVTDTASNANSRLLNLSVGGVSRFSIQKNGFITSGGMGIDFASATNPVFRWNNGALFFTTAGIARAGIQTNGFYTNAGYGLGFRSLGSGTLQAEFVGEADNVIGQRNGANAQTFNIYNTFTNASNYERGFMRWAGHVFEIGAEALGTGVSRQMRLTAAKINFLINGRNLTIDGIDASAAYIDLNSGSYVFRHSNNICLQMSSTAFTVPAATISMANLPTSNPAVAGRLWNDGGTVKISAG